MTDKKDSSKGVGAVSGTRQTDQVQRTESVGGVDAVKPTAGVMGVKGAGAIGNQRRATRTMTMAEREHLFQMINEEAEALLGGAGVSKEQKDILTKAVKMAVDSSLLDEEPESGK